MNFDEKALPPVGAVYAIGNFDGVHPGHRRLFDICKAVAKEKGVSVSALTFAGLEKIGGRLISVSDRDRFLREAGADLIICEDFAAVKNMDPEEFTDGYLVGRLSPSAVVCGEDFRFGKGAAGDATLLGSLLKRHGIPLYIAETVVMEGDAVSTSRIKAALSAGDVKTAERLLGRKYSFAYPVEEGKHLGRKLGAPTINQRFPEGMFIPKFGVYAGKVEADGRIYPCATNIGRRPTVDDGNAVTAESYIIGYTGDLYGQTVRVSLVDYLRGEIKFGSVDDLAKQIAKDAADAKLAVNAV